MSEELFKEAYGTSRPLALAGPSFGGISRADKDANDENTDNVNPKFYRGQFQNPTKSDEDVEDES